MLHLIVDNGFRILTALRNV